MYNLVCLFEVYMAYIYVRSISKEFIQVTMLLLLLLLLLLILLLLSSLDIRLLIDKAFMIISISIFTVL